MRSYNTQELTRSDDLGILPELWEVALVAGHQVLCTSGVGTLQESVIGRRGDLDKRSRNLFFASSESDHAGDFSVCMTQH
jgi:hypothetical protein